MTEKQAERTLVVETFPVGPLQCNCTLIGNTATGEAILVDPGGDADKIRARLDTLNLKLARIVHTHAHFDHFLASGQLKEATGATLGLHKHDLPLWDMLEHQCQLFRVPFTPVPPPDDCLEDEADIGIEGCPGVALHTPGHTPGSLCFHFESQQLVLAGDTLFRRSVGRTDLWGGDFDALKTSIQKKLYTLDEAAQVIPGHGPATTIGYELRHNPIVNGRSNH